MESDSDQSITPSHVKRYRRYFHCYPDDLNFLSSPGYLDDTQTVAPHHIELPFPIHDPFPYDGIDMVTHLLTEKVKYSKLKARTKRQMKRSEIKGSRKLTRQINKQELVPIYLLKYHKEPDPDMYFNCDYNYYYTGGCLVHVNNRAIDYMIRPDCRNDLCITDLNVPTNQFKLDFKSTTPIVNLQVIEDATNFFFLVREKKKVSVFFVKNLNENTELRWEKELTNIPFIDAKLDRFNRRHVALTDADFCVQLYDVEKNRRVREFEEDLFEDSIDNFSQIEFLNENMLVFVNRNQIKLFDIRSSNCKEELNTNLEPCNSICSFKLHHDDIILATRHDLCKYDIRNLQSLDHCSHMLSSPPCFIDVIDSFDDTFVLLSGHKVDQKVMFGSKSVNKLPLGVPSVLDTFKECRLKEDLLLKGKLEKFLTYSVTGIKLMEEENGKVLYSVNSLGQLFKQRISNELVGTHEAIQVLYDWCLKLPKPDNKLYVTGIAEMSDMRFNLLKKSSSRQKVCRGEQNKCNRFLRKFSNRYKEEKYSTMAGELMSIWDIDTDLVEEKPTSKDKQAHDKVNSWIDTLVFEESELEDGN